MGWTRFFRRSRWDAERAAEIEAYLDIETEDNIARGMPPDEARHAARRKIGNVTSVREEIYHMNSIEFLETCGRDALYALRMLRKNPGFTAVAVLSLALGIGANTAIFSLVDTLLLRSLPVQNPEQLVQVAILPTDAPAGKKAPAPVRSFAYPVIEEIRDRNQVFSGAFGVGQVNRTDILLDGRQEQIAYQSVSATYFSVLGAEPVVGRAFSVGEDQRGARPVAVISYGYWQRRFALDPDVQGKTFVFRDAVHTIIGVAPPWFTGIEVENTADLWVPVTSANPANRLFGDDAHHYGFTRMIARLKPGLSAAQALPSLNVLFSQILRYEDELRHAGDPEHRIPEQQYRRLLARQLTLLPAGRGLSPLRGLYSEPLLILMTIVGLVLLIACANIANLLLARAAARQREIGVRLAIGASRMRLLRQLLTESLLLALLGALAGMLFAAWAGSTLVAMVIGQTRSQIQLHLDLHVLGFTAGVALLTGILFGLGPALRSTRLDLTPTLRNETAGAHGRSRWRLPMAKVLVVSQVGLSLLLVLGAVLFVATLRKLLQQDMGFQRNSVLVASFGVNKEGSKRSQFLTEFRELLDRAQSIPGVESASISDNVILAGSTVSDPVYPEAGGNHGTDIMVISPGFFETMRTPLLVGRAFTTRDDASAPKVAIVNETLARQISPDGPAVGKRFGWMPRTKAEIEIVGVVRDTKWDTVRSAPPPFVYVPLFQPQTYPYAGSAPGGFLEVRVRRDPVGIAAALRQGIDATHVLSANPRVLTQQELVDGSLKQELLLAKLSGFFGLIGLLLAAVGLYGLMSYTVSRRTSEIGIRMALGARPGDLIRMVLGETALLVVLGVVAGTAVAMVAMRLVENFLFGVTRSDPAMTAIAAALLMAVALLAAWLPALRASRVAPIAALRHE